MNAPPFLISFSSTEQFLEALPDDARASYGQAVVSLAQRSLPPVTSIRCLATLFGYSPKFVGALNKHTDRYYRTFSIPKGREQRTIHAPKVALKVIQKWFGYHLARAVEFNGAVFGFVKGRSAIGAASLHCQADWIYSIDIENFFNSTPLSKVVASLVGLGYTQHGAELIGNLCCYQGMLAQGSPSSPVLSNLVFREADDELVLISQRFGMRYSRYADDIVFSGRGAFRPELKADVRSVIESRGWKVANRKEYLAKLPNRLKVHGLLVSGDRPRLTKGYRNRIRGFKHLLEAGKIGQDDIGRLRGHISYSNSVELYHPQRATE